MGTAVQIVFDCADVDRMANFWAEALHYILQPPPEGFPNWETFLRQMGLEYREGQANAIVDPDGTGPRVYFQRVPEGKTAKNRVHLDLRVSGGPGTPDETRLQRIRAEEERLTALGARELRVFEDGEIFTVMADPEGNEFCLT